MLGKLPAINGYGALSPCFCKKPEFIRFLSIMMHFPQRVAIEENDIF